MCTGIHHETLGNFSFYAKHVNQSSERFQSNVKRFNNRLSGASRGDDKLICTMLSKEIKLIRRTEDIRIIDVLSVTAIYV